MKVHLYNAQLRSNIEPSKEILSDFQSLPELTPETVHVYHNFLRRYGTHLRMGSFLGGNMGVLLPSTKGQEHNANDKLDITTFTSNINKVLSVTIHQSTAFANGGLEPQTEVKYSATFNLIMITTLANFLTNTRLKDG